MGISRSRYVIYYVASVYKGEFVPLMGNQRVGIFPPKSKILFVLSLASIWCRNFQDRTIPVGGDTWLSCSAERNNNKNNKNIKNMNYSVPSYIDIQRHPLIFSCIRTHSWTMLSPSGEQDQTPNHQSEMKPANKERGIMRASKLAKISSWPTQMMLTIKPDSWLWQLLIVETGCWRCQFHLAACDWMTRLSESQLALGWAARSENPMNVFVARLLTQWAAMHSLANTALDALLAIILWTTWFTVHWLVLTFQPSRSRKGYSRQTTKDQMAIHSFLGTPAGIWHGTYQSPIRWQHHTFHFRPQSQVEQQRWHRKRRWKNMPNCPQHLASVR